MDEYETCPFNKSHRILKFRMPGHIVKCKQNYKGESLQQCPFNAQHFVKVGKLPEHLETCQDYQTASREDFENYYKHKF